MNKPFVVVVGTDYSKHAEHALLAAYESARRVAPAELHVVHASFAAAANVGVSLGAPYQGVGPVPVLSVEEQQRHLNTHLDTVFGSIPGFREGHVRVFSHVIFDEPVMGLTRLASALDAQLLVVGTHGHRGLARWLLGSVAEGAVRLAPCPLLIIPPAPQVLPVPAIEPPCPRCVAERVSSKGSETWCEQHRQRHGRPYTYYQNDRVSNDHSLPPVAR